MNDLRRISLEGGVMSGVEDEVVENVRTREEEKVISQASIAF
jgi:hypothetical protein